MTLSIVPPNATPESLLIARIRNAWLNALGHRADWIDHTLDLAQALAEARALKKSDQDFSYWLDQNGFADLGKNDRAALIGMAGDLTAARKMLEATDRTSWRHIWENERLTWFPHVGKPPQREKKPEPAPKADLNKQRIYDVLSRRDKGLTPSEIVKDLGLTLGQVNGILFRNKNKKPKPPKEPTPRYYTGYQGLQSLTREQVDPDFKGNSTEFATKYGHGRLFTKEQIEAQKEEQVMQAMCDALKAAAKTLSIPLPKPETVQAWLAKPRKQEKLAEWLAPIEKILALVKLQ